MEWPPRGNPVKNRWKKQDKEILKQLRSDKRCEQVLMVDRGMHRIYCGGYFSGRTKKTKDGYRCEYHRSES
jgi:hypothetical protein